MLLKQSLAPHDVQSLIKAITLGEPFSKEIKLADLTSKQIEYIKAECYKNMGSMLSKMQLLDSYLKDKIKEGE